MTNAENAQTDAAVVVGIVIPWFTPADRPTEQRLEETRGLAEALECEVAFVAAQQIRRGSPSHLLPGGVLDRISDELEAASASLFIVDAMLTPVQQRNLEARLGVKVIDRTGLILEIFGLRARTKTGRLQVELARQLYERSRLVRTWTHLERQRGGRGFLAGPGETQLEADKRMLDTRIRRLRRDLEDVRRTRGLQRKSRLRSGTPVVALVGYTNAGKSTLFNALSGADVFAQDMPFATLDPTIRRVPLPGIGHIALVDTVGFVSDLPTHLIESFRATLEEAVEADLLVHVRDRSSPVDLAQKQDVEAVLDQLGKQSGRQLAPLIEVWNKCDLLDGVTLARLHGAAEHADPPAVLASATGGRGLDALMEMIATALNRSALIRTIILGLNDGEARAWLYENGDVIAETAGEDSEQIALRVKLSDDRFGQFQQKFPTLAAIDQS
ncbi:MAG: GTPase HflX [Pseudomonadota bacterium]